MRRRAAAIGATLCIASASAASAAPVKGTLLFRLNDARLQEVSGIAVGIVSPDVFYVQNDSGDSARFFAIDRHTGKVRTEFDVPGATNVDWEDIAVATDARGVASVWLADIGDNNAERPEVTIYRVDEPRVRGNVAVRTTPRPDVWRLTYPDGPHNAESLAVAPGGKAYIITKSPLGNSTAYLVPPKPDPRHPQRLGKVVDLQFKVLRTESPATATRQLSATGAAFGNAGHTLVLRTYTDAYIYRIVGGNVKAALTRRPGAGFELPAQPLGEAITIAGDQLVIASEEVASPVYAVPLPGAKPLRASSAPVTSKSAAHTKDPNKGSGSGTWWRVLAVVVLVLGVLIAVAVVRGRRAGYRPLR
ncbi:MAG TPA: hypothetical protein VJ831_03790 [Jatrophihabitantaceae bacterium]|nr:hypothetical protein [Jatrophihabitantaceae bacterium]